LLNGYLEFPNGRAYRFSIFTTIRKQIVFC
jgi:hypothetical protein